MMHVQLIDLRRLLGLATCQFADVCGAYKFQVLAGLSRERVSFLANTSMALALSAHIVRVQLSVYSVSDG